VIEQQDHIDFSHVPQSQGLGTGIRIILVIGVLCIFVIGGLSAFTSGYQHMWPSNHTLRMPLGNMPQ
jgi:hypothetical protein